jgi:hypothetical protein
MTMPKFTRRDFVFIADEIAPMLHWPTSIKELAQKLRATNPNFNEDKFVERATEAWEDNYQLHRAEQIDDNIPY